jgi:hypothetical protein
VLHHVLDQFVEVREHGGLVGVARAHRLDVAKYRSPGDGRVDAARRRTGLPLQLLHPAVDPEQAGPGFLQPAVDVGPFRFGESEVRLMGQGFAPARREQRVVVAGFHQDDGAVLLQLGSELLERGVRGPLVLVDGLRAPLDGGLRFQGLRQESPQFVDHVRDIPSKLVRLPRAYGNGAGSPAVPEVVHVAPVGRGRLPGRMRGQRLEDERPAAGPGFAEDERVVAGGTHAEAELERAQAVGLPEGSGEGLTSAVV